MRVFLAGATGALGQQLVPLLQRAGHAVVGTTRSPVKAAQLRVQGAEAVVLDALDRDATIRAVVQARPDAIVHQMTSIPAQMNLRRFDREFELTNRLRTEGTQHLLEAARESAVRRIVVQSFGGWPYARTGGPVKTERDPLDAAPPAAFRRTLNAIRQLEAAVRREEGMDGVALRYGAFYGPSTSLGVGGALLHALRRRRLPLVGTGSGIWSFIHIRDAASATLAALERAAPGIYNVADDEPAPVRDWLPVLAAAVGAPPPLRVPRWLVRMLVGEHAVVLMDDIRGISNAKAKAALAWQPRYASWRTGFVEGLGEPERAPSG
jgi:nucleoside-diphosphate-sugar epimerase